MVEETLYTVGGTIHPGKGLVYIPRQADRELLRLCHAGTFAFVLTPRQMGKSSLMERTAQELEKKDIRTVIIDLTGIGTEVSAEQWHNGLLEVIDDFLMLETDVFQWWEDHERLGLTQRLILFYEKVLLAEIEEPVVIFIDEIDTTLHLPFTDDFYAAIRYVHNNRAQIPVFQRLTFVLIGVATPGDLIKDTQRTPFNIGQRVDLTDFTLEEAKPLAYGLGLSPGEDEKVLGWVHAWTGGHPFLTQRLCNVIADQHQDRWTEAEVEEVVAQTFFGEMSEKDSNLVFVKGMLTQPKDFEPVAVLRLYRDVRRDKDPVHDQEQSLVKSHLKLSGVVRRQDGLLKVRNLIYARVFNLRWIEEYWPEPWYVRHSRLLFRTGVLLVTLFAIIATIFWFNADALREDAVTLQQQAVVAQQLAEGARQDAVREKEAADYQRALADSSATAARLARITADEQTELAQVNERVADQERLRAENLLADLRVQRAKLQVALREAVESDSLARQAAAEADEQRRIADNEREKTLGLSLAVRAKRRLSQIEIARRNALLAREAFLRNRDSGGDFLSEVYDALRSTLNELSDLSDEPRRGGPAEVQGRAHTDWVTSVAYSPDGNWIASSGLDGEVYLRPVDTQAQPIALQALNDLSVLRPLAFSPDRQHLALASVGDRSSVRIWEEPFDAGSDGRRLGEHPGVRVIAFGPTMVASAGNDGAVRLWDKTTGQLTRILRGHGDAAVHAVAFSSGAGALLATGGADGTVQVWDVATGEKLRELSGHEGGVHTVAFSPSHPTLLATGGVDGRVRLWDAATGEQHGDGLRGHLGPVNVVAFDQDGARLASGSGDKTVLVWDLSDLNNLTRRQPIILEEHTAGVRSLAFSPDGTTLVSGGTDRKVLLWIIDVEALADAVCEAVGYVNLSQEDWNTYLPGVEYRETCPQPSPSPASAPNRDPN